MPDLDLTIDEKAQRMRIYIGESDRWRGQPLYAIILETLRAHGLAGATVLRGVAGFGAKSRIHTAAILRLSEDLPLVIDVIDSSKHIQEALELIKPMVREGLITIEDVRVVKYTHRYLNPLPADRLVGEVMTRDVDTLALEQPVVEAWKKMLRTGIKAFPVTNSKSEVEGILTDEDLLDRAGIQQRLAVALRLDKSIIDTELHELENSPIKTKDVMSQPVISVLVSDSIGRAVALMIKHDLKRLVVIDDKRRLAGILSRLDILKLATHTAFSTPQERVPVEAIETVQDIMISPVPTVGEDETLPGLIDQLIGNEAHKVIVVDEGSKPLGIISDSDVVGRIQPLHQKGIINSLRQIGQPPASKVTAADLMSAGVTCVTPDTPVIEAMRMMLAEQRKWVVVTGEGGRVTGFIDRESVLKALAVK